MKSDKQLIKGSIRKWERVLKKKDYIEEHGNKDCPLCQVYFIPGCTDCPIKLETGASSCRNTPYPKWTRAIHSCHGGEWSDGLEKACLEMIEFLQDLEKKYSEEP